jgi:hypothetical protein
MRKCIEMPPLFGGQTAGKPAVHFPPCLMAYSNAKPLEHHETWKNDLALPTLLENQAGQMNKAFILNRSRQ